MNIKTPLRLLNKKVNEAVAVDADGNIVFANAMVNIINRQAQYTKKEGEAMLAETVRLTGPELTNRIATEVMGWESVNEVTPESRGDVVQITHKMWSPSRIWQYDYNPHLDKNQALEAVTTWVGRDLMRSVMFTRKLRRAVCEDPELRADVDYFSSDYMVTTAKAETVCRALLAAFDWHKEGGDGGIDA